MPSLSRSHHATLCISLALILCWLFGCVFTMVAKGGESAGASSEEADSATELVAPAPVVADPVAPLPDAAGSFAEQAPIAPAPVLHDPPESSFGFQPAAQPDEPDRYEIEPILEKITGPRELLRAYEIDESYFNQLIDGRPLGEDEKETLLKVMYRLRSFEMTDIEQWAKLELNLGKVFENPAAHRGLLFRVWGRVTKVETCHPLPEVADRFGFDTYYRCELTLNEDEQPAVIFTRAIPKKWQGGGPVDERAGAFGMLLKFASKDPQHPVPVFLAPRIAWYPDTPLGRLGMDVGLLDSVQNRTGLAKRDREAFYQMLEAVKHAKPGELARKARKQLKNAAKELVQTDQDGKRHYSVVPLFNKPGTQRGRLVLLSGVVQRTLRIRVEEPDITKRFGINHYYELYVYPDDSQDNPVVFCVRELPEGMPTGDGPDYREEVDVAGFFFKTWAYAPRAEPRATIASITKGPVKTLPDGTTAAVTLLAVEEGTPKGLRIGDRIDVDGTGVYDTCHEVLKITKGGLVVTSVPYTEDVNKSGMTMSGWTRLQLAPLLIGRKPVWRKREFPIDDRMIGAIAGGLFVVTLIGIWFALWRYGRGDKAFHEKAIAKRFAPAGNVSLNEIGFQDDGLPDFSGLEEMERQTGELGRKDAETKDQPNP